uniref:Uncharacterized protein n=1 Tax=Magallana gigas TaxID=29159 RepID=A0A8W8MMU4_MAGGI
MCPTRGNSHTESCREKYCCVRCSPAHIVNDTINTESIENLVPPKNTSFVNRTTFMELVEQLKEEALQRGSKRIDFDDPSLLSDRDYLTVKYDEQKI